MIITAATPRDLLEWFHARQGSQKVLCVLLAPSRGDQKKLSTLVQNLYEADATLGEEVAFLLLHPRANRPLGLDHGYGRYAALRGTAFGGAPVRGELAYSLREAEVFRDMDAMGDIHRTEIAECSARAMALFVPEFMKLFGLQPSELPALCVLVKGSDDSITVPLGKDWTTDTLLTMFEKLRKLTDGLPNFNVEYQALAGSIPPKVRNAEDAAKELSAKRKHVVKMLERILTRHGGTEADRNLVADLMARRDADAGQLQHVLSSLSFSSSERFRKDGQVQKVQTFMRRIIDLRTTAPADAQARNYVVSIADRARVIVRQREELLKGIRELQPARVVETTHARSLSFERIHSVLETINLAGDLGEKFVHALEWVRKMIGA